MTRAIGLLAAASLAACSSGGPRVGTPAPAAATPGEAAPVRLFHSGGEHDFWVLHAPDRALVIAGGARLELAPSGEITAASWDLEIARRHHLLVGALAVPARLGGGFVHWTPSTVFRSTTFTGPLEPIGLDPAVTRVRGVRAGLSSVLVFTDAGPREIVPGAASLRAVAEPGLRDLVALSDRRAARVDVLGRLAATDDGGRSWADLSASVGLAVRNLAVSDAQIFVDTWDTRVAVRPGGKVDPGEPAGRPSHDTGRQFQIEWPGLRTGDRSDAPWGFGPATPLASVVAGGGAVGDGTAWGVVQSTPVRVDLHTGKVLTAAAEWLPNGLQCQPVRAPDALLFACAWERYQANGGYVLRAGGSGPPEIERAFSDDGSFVSDDDGALGFVGSCRHEPRYFDPEEQAKAIEGNAEPTLAPVICVRRGPGDWVERRVDLPEGATLVAWIAAKDGRAAALVTTGDPLPPPASPAGRVLTQSGVRLVQIDRDLQGWSVPRPGGPSDRIGVSSILDRRFRLRDDGTIDGWLSPPPDASSPVAVGASIDPRGDVTVHAAAPGMIAIAIGGPFGLSISREGDLYETTDHGRSYRAAGPSPVPPSVFGQGSCSALGCALGPVVRLGWGGGGVVPRVIPGPPRAAERTSRTRRLTCAPAGLPLPLVAPSPAPAGARTQVTAGWGDTIELVRNASAPDPTPPSPSGRPAPASPPAAKKPPRPSPAVLRTHTLLVRPPFSPRASVRRIEATDAGSSMQRISAVTPLLGPAGDVQLLLAGDRGELLVAGDRLTPLAPFENRRYVRHDGAGLATANGRALVLGDFRRRLTLEDHGPSVNGAPVALGGELDDPHRRPFTLGRRDDGAVAVLVLDGPAPEIVGAATIDRNDPPTGPLVRLAPWSSLVAGDHPSCQPTADPAAIRALLVIDPQLWLTLDPAALPGVSLARQGIIQVRWGRERVCLEALDAALIDQRTRGTSGRGLRLVARWTGEGERGAALNRTDLRQDLVCRVE